MITTRSYTNEGASEGIKHSCGTWGQVLRFVGSIVWTGEMGRLGSGEEGPETSFTGKQDEVQPRHRGWMYDALWRVGWGAGIRLSS